jgi:lipoprotein LprG
MVLGAALLVTGCGGGDKPKAAEKTPAEVMKIAKKHFDDASSVHIALSTESVPSSGNGVLGATGDVTHAPAFKGEVRAFISGFTATVPITSVGGKVYAKLPLQTKYAVIKPSAYGAPDPADFADPDNGISALLIKLEGLKKQGQSRSGGTILTTYSGTLPGSAVKKVIPSAVAKKTYKTLVGVDEKGTAITVKVTGPFFTGSDDVTYDVKLTGYGQGVTISVPTS